LHLSRAIDQAADGALQLVYVRDEDRDLDVLRKSSSADFQRIVRRLCPDELTLRYRRPNSEGRWGLEVQGEGTVETVWSAPLQPITLKPVSVTVSEAVYQIKILDETKRLKVIAHNGDGQEADNGDEKEDVAWELVPAELDTSQVWVYPGNGRVDKRGPVSAPEGTA
jgi:hypothetical protein